VATYLSVVAVFEVEGELHQGIGDVSGGLVGEGALVLLLGGVFASSHRALLVDLFFGAEALALDDDGIDVVEDAVEDGGGERAVVIEDLRPVFVGTVAGDHYWRALVALTDDLEE